MRVKDAEVGTQLILGTFNDGDIVWTKVSDDCDFVSESSVGLFEFDIDEYDSPSRARRRFGNCFFPHSNIFQWLNATGANWFRPLHEFDISPRYDYRDGFLSGFEPGERALLVDRDITVAVPLGSKKEFGKTYDLTCKVCLPAATEIGYVDPDLAVEGAMLPELRRIVNRDLYNGSTMTRTGITDGGHIISYVHGSASAVPANRRWAVRPMIRVHGDTEITDGPGVRVVRDEESVNRYMKVLCLS